MEKVSSDFSWKVPRGPMASNEHKLARKKIHLDIKKQFLHRGRTHAGLVAQKACSVSILGDTQTLSGGDSQKPDLALMSSVHGTRPFAKFCVEMNQELSGAAIDMPLSVPSSGWSRKNQSR